jgi:hypothetical protein
MGRHRAAAEDGLERRCTAGPPPTVLVVPSPSRHYHGEGLGVDSRLAGESRIEATLLGLGAWPIRARAGEERRGRPKF